MSSPVADLTTETLATIRRVVVEAREARAHYVKNMTKRDAALRLEKANVAYGLVAETYLEHLLEMASRCVSVETIAKLSEALAARLAWREALEGANSPAMYVESREGAKCFAEFSHLAASDLAFAAAAWQKEAQRDGA
jgi:hypothetical protein